MAKKTLSKQSKNQKTRKNRQRTIRGGGADDKNTVSRNEESTYTAKRGTWDFYILQALDKDPKTENEITELIRNQNPHKFKGKTSDNTINARLQKLVREGNAQRIANQKGKRTVYKYFVWS